MTTVYALIPVFNRLELTRRIVEDLRAQRGCEVRIVVIDDASTDGTKEWLATQPDIVTIRGNGDLWWAGAVDVALRRIVPEAQDDDYVLLINNDTTVGPEFVATLIGVSRGHGGAAVGSALRDELPPHELISIGPRIDIGHRRVSDAINELPLQERRKPKPVYEVDALSGRGTLYPVRVVRATGFLHPRLLPHYHADYEFACRARRKGFKTLVSTAGALYTEKNFGVHRVPGSRWQRLFGKGSPANVLHRICFWLLVGTPLQRAAAAPGMLVDFVVRLLPARFRWFFHAGRLLVRAPFSGQARARLLMHLPPFMRGNSYNAWHAYTAGTLIDVHGKNVLVVGCNVGRDCAYFVRLGAQAVHGLDVIEEVGQAYKHRRVLYLRASVEAIPVRGSAYDLVFCFATMEHVPNVERAFGEMARVTREGGLIYSVASPLWNSRYGHHKGELFERFPWIHLRMTEQEILDLCRRERVEDPSGRYPMSVHVAYMLNPRYFNMMPAREYVSSCAALADEVEICENSLAFDREEFLTADLSRELEPKGYSREELLAVTHTFVARKRAHEPAACVS